MQKMQFYDSKQKIWRSPETDENFIKIDPNYFENYRDHQTFENAQKIEEHLDYLMQHSTINQTFKPLKSSHSYFYYTPILWIFNCICCAYAMKKLVPILLQPKYNWNIDYIFENGNKTFFHFIFQHLRDYKEIEVVLNYVFKNIKYDQLLWKVVDSDNKTALYYLVDHEQFKWISLKCLSILFTKHVSCNNRCNFNVNNELESPLFILCSKSYYRQIYSLTQQLPKKYQMNLLQKNSKNQNVFIIATQYTDYDMIQFLTPFYKKQQLIKMASYNNRIKYYIQWISMTLQYKKKLILLI